LEVPPVTLKVPRVAIDARRTSRKTRLHKLKDCGIITQTRTQTLNAGTQKKRLAVAKGELL
jgi:hypothetical protein